METAQFQGTASEATLVALLGAKAKIMEKLKTENPDLPDYEMSSKLIAYASGE